MRNFGSDTDVLDETLSDVFDNDDELEPDQDDDDDTFDNGTDDQVDDDASDDESDDDKSDDNAEPSAPTLVAQQVWDDVVKQLRAGENVEAAAFAAQFAQCGEKDAHEKLNELNQATTVELARDTDIDPADKGMLFSSLAILVEAVHGILPDKKVSKSGTVVDPKAVARDNATRLKAVWGKVYRVLEKIEHDMREQAIVAGLVTSDQLELHDNGHRLDDDGQLMLDSNGDPMVFDNWHWLPDVDTSGVTFTKKFGECLDYIQGVPGAAKGTGKGAAEPFVAGQTRYDNKGNACRFDGTNYWFTPKGGSEKATKYTSPSTLAKKEVTNGTEVNGKLHFRHHSDPTT